MAQKTSADFDHIIDIFQTTFEQAQVIERDEAEERSVLELHGRFGVYRVRLSEIIVPGVKRKYSYYILKGNRVIAGFDNASDPRALRLKYGDNFSEHRLELIPHRHTENKMQSILQRRWIVHASFPGLRQICREHANSQIQSPPVHSLH